MERDPTSKFPKRLARDIYLSNDVGRDSPFDFFKDRTVTRMQNARNPDEPQDLLFAEKMRKRVPCPVNYNVIPHHARVVVSKLVEEGGLSATRIEDEQLNDKGYVKPAYIRNVAFPKAPRFDDSVAKNHVQLRKQLMEERAEVIRKDTDKNPPQVRDIVVKPDCSKAPTMGTYVAPRPSSHTFQRYTELPWQRKEKADLERDERGDGGKGVDGGDQRSASAPLDNGTMEETQEAIWSRKNKATLEKHGLIAGGRRERLRQKTIENRANASGSGAVNFRLQSSRNAPIAFQPRAKEVNDSFYVPKYDVTTSEPKKVADVRLNKYASRPNDTNLIKSHVDKLLTIEHLSKYYKKQKKLETTSAFRTPDDVGVNDDVYVGDDGVYKPITAFDDYSLHPPTPPKMHLTRKYQGTPDLSNYADRNGEPLDALFAGNRVKYEQKAKAALRREGLL
jgi:hypothetical protein